LKILFDKIRKDDILNTVVNKSLEVLAARRRIANLAVFLFVSLITPLERKNLAGR